MKTFIAFTFTAFLLTSCYVENVEPRYDPRDRIIGHYEVEEYSETYDEFTYYEIRVSKSSYHDEIILNNFYGSDIRVRAIVDYDHIDIPLQHDNGFEVSGYGTIHGDELHLSYYVRDEYSGTRRDYCETVAWME